MPDPILVEVVRGTLVESRHRGAVAVVDAIAAAVIARVLPMSETERALVERHARAPVKNWRGVVVGEVRAGELG